MDFLDTAFIGDLDLESMAVEVEELAESQMKLENNIREIILRDFPTVELNHETSNGEINVTVFKDFEYIANVLQLDYVVEPLEELGTMYAKKFEMRYQNIKMFYIKFIEKGEY